MKKTFYFLLLPAVFLFNAACQKELPEPDYSGLPDITYTLNSVTSSSATNDVGVQVYPNPFAHLVRVDVFASSGEEATIYFSDEKGKYSRKIVVSGGNRTSVEVVFRGMPDGIYMCEVRANGKVSRYRLIKA